MLTAVFLQVLDMTKLASVVILVVILARLLLRRMPKWISYALWGVVLFRLLCPLSVKAPVSVVPELTPVSQGYALAGEPISLLGAGRAAAGAAADLLNGGLGIQWIYTTEQGADGLTRVVTSDWWDVWILFGQYVWLAGILVLLVHSAVSCGKIRKKVRVAVPLRGNICLADDIACPFVMGLLRPKIYLPVGLGEREQAYIILHEQHHLRRRDHLWKTLGFLALCVHWFNPLVWAAFLLSGKDMEMSCDEAVVGKLGGEIRADYAASLLAFATGRRVIAGTPLAFGEGDIGDRIRNLAKWKKPALWAVVAAAAVCGALAVCLLTDPPGSQPADSTPPGAAVEWFDYTDSPGGLPWDSVETVEIPEFPGVTFSHNAERITVSRPVDGTEQDGEVELVYGMPIWNAWFCDLTGDGFPEICASLSFGSGVIDNRIIVVDYANGASYLLENRMRYDYVLRLQESDGALYVDQTDCTTGSLVASGRLIFADGCIQIQPQLAE